MFPSLEAGIIDITKQMSQNERGDLASYLNGLLMSDLSNSDYKRIWNKSETDIIISGRGKSGAMKSFFQLILDILEGRKCD